MRFARLGRGIFDRVIGALFYLSCILLAFIMLIVSFQVAYRIFFGGLPWVMEVGEYILLMIIFLGTAWLLKQEGHVKIDVIFSRLGPKTQLKLNIITSVIATIVCLVLLWYGSVVTWENFELGTRFYKEIGLPRAPVMLFIPIGFFLLFIQFIRRIRGYLAELRASGVRGADTHDHNIKEL